MTDEQKARRRAYKAAWARDHYKPLSGEKRVRALAYLKEYREANKDQISAAKKEWWREHREQDLTRRKAHYAANLEREQARAKAYHGAHKEQHRITAKAYYEANRERTISNVRRWKKANWDRLKIQERISARIRSVLKGQKTSKTMKLVGCDRAWLVAWIEVQFHPEMTWENYGPVWHVDHKRPCASFDLNDPQQQRLCFHWTNLQPLFAADNLRKSKKWEGAAAA